MNIFGGIIMVLLFIITTVAGKLILNFLAYKLVSISAIFKSSDDLIYPKTVKRGFRFGLLADFLGLFTVVTVAALIAYAGVTNHYGSEMSLIEILSFIAVGAVYFMVLPNDEYLGGLSWIVACGVAVAAVFIFIFSFFFVLKDTTLSKSKRFLAALTVTLISSPYYFFIPFG